MTKKDKDIKGQDDSVKNKVEENLDKAIEEVEKEIEEANNNDDDTDVVSQEEKLKEEVQKEKDKFLRLFAEFENYKKRTSKERLDLFKTANKEVMLALLPVLDDFDRALIEIRKTDDENLVKGVELIHTKFKETLNSKGLEIVEVEQGEVFDADKHEAITQIPAPNEDLKGKIVDVVERGYKLGERIIRYPKVVTGK
ncbi:nucleotide exchange factor GrpE [Zunongwangia sp.]|uniref:nucleotide exchange factor GrpE n=1 Tax=Zunongwangia sp. TaxID=1965325 RepID=UPI003AA7C552